MSERASPKLELGYAEALGIASEVFATWQAASCPTGVPAIQAVPSAPVSCERVEFAPEGPNANVVVFRESDWAYGPAMVALTHVTFSSSSGEILDVDMELNVVDYAPSRQFLRYVMTHEAGHYFGIDHTLDQDALMSSFYSVVVDQPAVLTPDDVGAICAVYPPDPNHSALAATCDPSPPRGFSTECGGDVEGGCTMTENSKPSEPFGLLFGCLAFALLFLRVRSRALIARDMR